MNIHRFIRMVVLVAVVVSVVSMREKSIAASPDDVSFPPDGWQELVNTRYGYTLWYPPSGEAKLYEPEGILHINLDGTSGPFLVYVHDNFEGFSAEEWAEHKRSEYLLPPLIDSEEISVDDKDAFAYRSFAGDHWNQNVILAQSSSIYEIIFPQGNSQEQMFRDILMTFRIGIPLAAIDDGFDVIEPHLTEVISDLDVPRFLQGDSQWGGNTLGTCSDTVAESGCAITSLAMIFNYYQSGFTDPGKLNSCLRNNGGYLNGCLVYWSNRCMPSGVSYNYPGDIDQELRNGRPIVVGVDNGNHWVVVIGKRSDGRYNINNPSAYSTSTLGVNVLDPGRISDTRRYNGPPPPSDTTPPTGDLTAPADGTVVQKSVTIKGNASDAGSGVDRVEFWAKYDGAWHTISTDTSAPYEYTWDMSKIANQEIVLRLDIYDKAGNTASSSTRTIIKKDTNPKLYIDTPKDKEEVSGSVTIWGWAADLEATSGTGVSQVHIYLDGPADTGTGLGAATYGIERSDVANASGEQFRKSGYRFVWNTDKVTLGDHTLYVYAQSTVTQKWEYKTRAIKVVSPPDTTPPTGGLTAPANGTIVQKSVTIKGNASDEGSGVDRVVFRGRYDGEWHDIGQPDTTAPYETTWDVSKIPDQEIELGLDVYDKAGNVAYSPGGTRKIVKDTTPPTFPDKVMSEGSESGVWQKSVRQPEFTWSGAKDGMGDVEGYLIYWGTDPNGTSDTLQTGTSFNAAQTVADEDGAATYYLRMAVRDTHGNTSEWKTVYTFRYDNSTPVGSISLNYDWGVAHSRMIPVRLHAEDTGSGVREMRLSNDGTTWNDWQPVSERIWWPAAGVHSDTISVMAQYRDEAENVCEPVSGTLTLNFYPPKPSSAKYHVTTSVFGVNGVTSQSATYTVNATAGQIFASGDYANGGTYQTTSGFWTKRGVAGNADNGSTLFLPFVQR